MNIFERNLKITDRDVKVLTYGMVTFNLLYQVIDDFVGGYDLGIGEFVVLWNLRIARGEMNMKRVKDNILMYSGASITKVAEKLLQKGLITRRENPDSRREKLVKATPAGIKLCDKVLRGLQKLHNPLLKGLSSADKKTLLGSTKVMLGNILKIRGGEK